MFLLHSCIEYVLLAQVLLENCCSTSIRIPLSGSLDGHTDGVHCLSRHSVHVAHVFSGSCNGEVRMWDLQSRYSACIHNIQFV